MPHRLKVIARRLCAKHVIVSCLSNTFCQIMASTSKQCLAHTPVSSETAFNYKRRFKVSS